MLCCVGSLRRGESVQFTSLCGVGPIHFVTSVALVQFTLSRSCLLFVASRRFTSTRFVIQFTSSDFTASVRCVASFKFTLLPWLSSLPCVHFSLRRVALVHFVTLHPYNSLRHVASSNSLRLTSLRWFVASRPYNSLCCSRSRLVLSRCVGSHFVASCKCQPCLICGKMVRDSD